MGLAPCVLQQIARSVSPPPATWRPRHWHQSRGIGFRAAFRLGARPAAEPARGAFGTPQRAVECRHGAGESALSSVRHARSAYSHTATSPCAPARRRGRAPDTPAASSIQPMLRRSPRPAARAAGGSAAGRAAEPARRRDVLQHVETAHQQVEQPVTRAGPLGASPAPPGRPCRRSAAARRPGRGSARAPGPAAGRPRAAASTMLRLPAGRAA